MDLKYYRLNIIYLVALTCTAFPQSRQDLKSVYNICCNLGRNTRLIPINKNQTESIYKICSIDTSSLIQADLYSYAECSHVAKICCYQMFKKITCDLAVNTVKYKSILSFNELNDNLPIIKKNNFLKYYRQCVLHPEILKNSTLFNSYFSNKSNFVFGYSYFVFRECCSACKLGMFAAIYGFNCNFLEQNIYNTYSNKAFEECCFTFKKYQNFNLSNTDTYKKLNLEMEILKSFRNDLDFKTSFDLSIILNEKINNNQFDSEIVCLKGFEKNINKNVCVDIDECKNNLHNCNLRTHFCKNTNGSFNCEKKKNYFNSNNLKNLDNSNCKSGEECIKIDFCKIGNHNCKSDEKCIMAQNKFLCIKLTKVKDDLNINLEKDEIKNNSNTVLKKSLHENNLINEKLFNEKDNFIMNLNKSCENDSCKNKINCKKGFNFNNITSRCEDINECQINNFSCPFHFRCDNTYGSYQCIRETSCGTGYTYNSDTHICVDIDECKLGNHNCEPPRVCINIQGSFRCEIKKCDQDYRLTRSGQCEKVICVPGFKFNNFVNKCIDLNECELQSNLCKNGYKCINTLGSYKCIQLDESPFCIPGTKFSNLKNECVDINECEFNFHKCNHSNKCINTYGSYYCNCEKGFFWNIITENCEFLVYNSKSSNSDIKKLFTNTCDSQICQFKCNKIGEKFQCICPESYRLESNGRNCSDIDECKLNKNICNKENYNNKTINPYIREEEENFCINTPGSYKCINIECPIGYFKDKNNILRCKLNNYSTKLCLNELNCQPNKPIIYSYSFVSLKSNNSVGPVGLRIVSIRGASKYDYEYNFIKAISKGEKNNKFKLANKEDFLFVRDEQDNIFVKRSLEGPQEVQLEYQFKLQINNTEIILNKLLLTLFVSKYIF